MDLKQDIRLALSKMKPRISKFTECCQDHKSHWTSDEPA